MSNVTRRNFLAASAVTAGLVGLAGCDTTQQQGQQEAPSGDGLTAPSADSYPIDPDGEGVEAKWSSEALRDGWTRATNPDGCPEIGVMDTARILQVDGYAFRDMNGNGKLDLWEDWRQSVDDRAKALADSLSAEDIFPLLFHGGAQSGEGDDPEAMDWLEAGSRGGVTRFQPDIESYGTHVAWINEVQEICEKSKNGIPYLNSTDPYYTFEIPPTYGLAASMDKDIWRKAGMWQARAWRSAGIRIELGPQIDVYSEPTGERLSGSVSEDPAVNRDFVMAYGGGMQSTWGDDEATDDQGWGKDSCAVMLKHFVGEGCPEGGRGDHYDSGKWNVFPGSNFSAHLIPFLDGGLHLESKTGEAVGMMPCYGIAYDPNDPEKLGEHVGSSYSEHNVSILRDLGYDGMLCTDWGILETLPSGVKNLSVAERFAKLMKNTISQHGGSFQPDVAAEAYQLMVDELGEDEALSMLRDNARHLFKAEITVDLFDQPYSDRIRAKEIFESEAAAAFGAEASDKCIVMLKNKGNVISEEGVGDKPKVYVPLSFSPSQVVWENVSPVNKPSSIYMDFDEEALNENFTLVTDEIGEPTGDPFEGETENQYQESDIIRQTNLSDVKYAIIKIENPNDAFQGADGNDLENWVSGENIDYKPISLQYRPYTADNEYVRKESLNPEDEFGEYENRSVYGKSTYALNEASLDLVIQTKKALPEDAKLILIISADRPMVFSEIEPYADVILMGWRNPMFGFNGMSDAAFVRIITGQSEPYGVLAHQQPASMDEVYKQLEDVPRDMECYVDSEGNAYDFCFGLNWGGVIDDERTQTYKVNPLTEPETEVVDA